MYITNTNQDNTGKNIQKNSIQDFNYGHKQLRV